MNGLDLLEKAQLKEDRNVTIGDTVKVHFRIIEGKMERVQVYEGLVLAIKHGGIRTTFTVRKISFGIGVERIFPLHSPRIQKIELVKRGKVRRAKLYYIRNKIGKAARIKEKIIPKKMKNKNNN